MLAAACSSHKLPSDARTIDLPTVRGTVPVAVFCPSKPARALVVLASGDGGWTDFEEKISRGLAADGFCVAGWDVQKYAGKGSYDGPALARDISAALRDSARACGGSGLRVVLMGYSTGAEQMVAVAAEPGRPRDLAGLLLVSPGHRGRFGITMSDLLGMPPAGPGTFSLEELRPRLAGLRIFQIHGEHDPLDQTSWLDGLAAEHRLAVYPEGWHLFNGAPPDFIAMVTGGVDWILRE